jgi:hypothetical protein
LSFFLTEVLAAQRRFETLELARATGDPRGSRQSRRPLVGPRQERPSLPRLLATNRVRGVQPYGNDARSILFGPPLREPFGAGQSFVNDRIRIQFFEIQSVRIIANLYRDDSEAWDDYLCEEARGLLPASPRAATAKSAAVLSYTY